MWVSRDKEKRSDYELWQEKPVMNRAGVYIFGDIGFIAFYSVEEWPFAVKLRPGECKKVIGLTLAKD